MRARAWSFATTGGPGALRLVEDDVADPGPGEALLRIRAIGLNRSDLMYMAGHYFGPPPSPSFLGQEAVGEIVRLGPEIEGRGPVAGGPLTVGMRVGLMAGRIDYAATGTYRTAGTYRQDALLPLPGELTFAEGAGLWVAALTAVGGLRAGGLTGPTAAGKRVLVTAASSGVGVAALQVVRAVGAETLAATTSPEKAGALAALADHVLVTADGEKLQAAVQEVTGGSGVDLAFDPVGYAFAPALMEVAAAGGSVVFYGILAGNQAPLDLRALILKDLAVHGFTVYRLQRDSAELKAVVETVLGLVRAGSLRPHVAAEYPFAEAPAALAQLARNKHVGKIVLTVD